MDCRASSSLIVPSTCRKSCTELFPAVQSDSCTLRHWIPRLGRSVKVILAVHVDDTVVTGDSKDCE